MTSRRLPSRLVVVAGTYDGVLAGWDTSPAARPADDGDVDLRLLRRRSDGRHLKLSFAAAAHDGSVRCTDVCGAPSAAPAEGAGGDDGGRGGAGGNNKRPRPGDGHDGGAPPPPMPGSLLSGGHDEVINVYNLRRNGQDGEIKTPGGLGMPTCCSFAPPGTAGPASAPPTHALFGTASGKIVILRRRDWSVQHVLSGHDGGGVGCLAVHPTGRMALSGGRRDGKIVLWDLTKGRLAFAHRLPKTGRGGTRDAVGHIVWSGDGSRYAYCHGTKVTARDVSTGEDLLDVDLPGRVNQLAFVGGPEGMFVACACDDGGLPVLEVGQLEETEDADTRRAIMAIEPVDGTVAGDDRLKCVRAVEGGSGFLVVTANSGGVVSLMDLEGAARMMLTPGGEDDDEDGERQGPGGSGSDGGGSDTDDEDEFEAAVEILDSVRLGSGARITDLSAWSYGGGGLAEFDPEGEASSEEDEAEIEEDAEEDGSSDENGSVQEAPPKGKKKVEDARKEKARHDDLGDKIQLDAEAVEKARRLVGQAKRHQKRKKRKSSSGR